MYMHIYEDVEIRNILDKIYISSGLYYQAINIGSVEMDGATFDTRKFHQHWNF